MKIDLHTHSVLGSGCSRQTVERIAADARAHGMDAVCLTDHGNMAGRDEARRVSEETGLPIFMGIEVTCAEGDILIFGLSQCDGLWMLPYEELRTAIDLERHALIPAHAYRGGVPFGSMPQIVSAHAADFAALEVYSCNVIDDDTRRLIDLAAEVGLPTVGCGDSHSPGSTGLNYTDFEDEIASVEELITALKSGNFKAVRGDYEWKARWS